MRNRTRTAVVAATLGGLCMLMLPVARSADTPAPVLDSYQASGTASGVRFSFTFTNSIFERLVDLVLPYATSDLRSEGGGQVRSEAAQLYPGDLVAGGTGESGVSGFPGYTIAYTPQPNGKNEDVEEEQAPYDNAQSLLAFFPFPPPPPVPPLPESVPIRAAVGHNTVAARPNESSSEAVTQHVVIGPPDGPHVEIRSLRSYARGVLEGVKAMQVSRTEVNDLAIVVASDVTIRIGKLVSEVKTSSDGTTGSVDASSFTVSGVEVTMAGESYGATIDNTGIRLTGPIPAEVPSFTPVDLNRTLETTLDDQGVTVTLGTPTSIVEGAIGEASIGGLLIRFTGTIPVVPVPPIVAELQRQLEDAILPQLPPEVRALYNRPTCLGEDIVPRIPPEVLESLPEDLINGIRPLFALCAGREALPGPGSGGVTTLTIGSVQGVAVTGISFLGNGDTGSTDGGFIDGGLTDGATDGGFTDGATDGTVPDSPPSGPPAALPRLFGLVARMPSGALVGAGIGFLVLAVAFAFGPSLRPWRRTI